uniref:Uncharacterized protein n=1 Tax=Anguilla anguilla TaxID=7936 RepID=A0A0E9VES1_ANGAN
MSICAHPRTHTRTQLPVFTLLRSKGYKNTTSIFIPILKD